MGLLLVATLACGQVQKTPAPTEALSPVASATFTNPVPNQPPGHTPTLPPTETPIPTQTPTSTITPEPTSSATYEPVTFAVIGDYGSGNQYEADVAALVISWQPDFVITTGDNNYPSGSDISIDENIGQFYHGFIYPYIGAYGAGAEVNRFFPTLGNHDWMTGKAKPYFDYFTLPGNERYYDFTRGAVHFFALDNDSNEPDGVGRSSKQAQWLQDSLAASTEPWKIVYMHYPPYSSAMHGSTNWAQWSYAAWGATAVLAGHDHTYERLMVDGIPYFVNGVGGGAIYDFRTPLPTSLMRYNSGHGAMLVKASGDQMIFQFISVTGEIIDSYEMAP